MSSSSRVRILDDGSLEVIDPRWEDIGLLQAVDSAFAVESSPLPGFREPRFISMRRYGCGVLSADLGTQSMETLWHRHEAALRQWSESKLANRASGEASVLELKCELADRLLACCVLCARRCEVNRNEGEKGFCGLGVEAVLAESFVHIGEEPPINPSHLFSLAGCALRCRFCQQSDILFPSAVHGSALDPLAWRDVQFERARSVSFVGGNPDESLAAILKFLDSAPEDFGLPVVWNSHAYSSPEAIALLDGVVDVYLPDLKYASEDCARRWSEIENYFPIAQRAITTMVEQNVPVIVRVLLLPGHLDCCHIPAFEFLASLPVKPLVSIRSQYSPDWRITPCDKNMAGRVPKEETQRAYSVARSLGLSPIEKA